MLFSRRSSQGRSDPSPASPQVAQSPSAASQSGESDIARAFDGLRTQSFIDASLIIVGDLETEGDVQLEGRICGNVRCAQLIVGKDAAITGAVIAEEAIVRGRIVGTIRAPVVIIQGTAHVESEIVYSMLAIDDGATFEGAMHRSENPLAATAATAPLEELRRLTLAGGEAASADAEDKRNEGSAAASLAALPAPAANGHDTTELPPSPPPA